MKMSTGALAGLAVPGTFKRLLSNRTTEINIYPGTITGDISPNIYGQFIEHLGRAIYGGIFDEGSPLSDAQGFRKDVLEKVKQLNTPLMRYPGGTVTKIYHWKDGVGPVADRPVRKNLIWGGNDNNHVGTDEFMAYSRLLGAEPFLTVNMSTGTPEEAADWVEYCNATETYFASQRKKNGHAAPYNVKYWGLGNEEGANEDAGVLQNPQDYIKRAWYYAKLMKLQDPSIKLIMVGDKEDWNKQILQDLHPICDYISYHPYVSTKAGKPESLHTAIADVEKEIRKLAAQIKTITPVKVENFSKWYRFPSRQQPVKIALDEWGIWESSGEGAYGLEMKYNWNHALGVATFLNIFHRNADVIGMATWAQTVNVLAPIMTNASGSFCQTVFYPMELYRRLCGNKSIRAEVSDNPALDVAASMDEKTGKITVAIVSKDLKEAQDIKIKGKWTAHELNAPSIDAVNNFDKPNVVSYKKRVVSGTYTIAAHGITILESASV